MMQTDTLFAPVRMGALSLAHRVVMAPLTRMRAKQPGDLPHALNATYYGQRASKGGLQITEATDITAQAHGYPWVPGIYSPEQIAGWRLVTDAVHAKGGFIFCQLWHTGRVSHSSMQPGGALPVAPSAVAHPGDHMDARANPTPFETPRALETGEIASLTRDFVQAARNARQAGFDGVEIHGANGYLLDQFLRTGTNKRTDAYGGSIENRARFLLEVVDAVAAEIGSGRIGVRLSPWGTFGDMSDDDGPALWDYVIAELGKRKLAYLHLIEPRADFTSDDKPLDANAPDVARMFKKLFGGPVISAGGYSPETARAAVADGKADAIAFGRAFISNPDLPDRLRRNAELNRHDRATFYGGAEVGYTDYPFHASAKAASRRIIALHCSGASAAQWRKLGAMLGPSYELTAPEHYGGNITGHWTGEHAFTLADEAERTIDLIDQDRGRVHLIGHSYGGGVALHVALRRPQAIASLALYEPSAFHLLRKVGADAIGAFAEIKSVTEETGARVLRGDCRGAAAYFVDYWDGTGAWDALLPDKQLALARWAPKAPLDFAALIEEPTNPEDYSDLHIPVLIMRGEHALKPSRMIAEALQALLPDACLVKIAGAGHMGPFTHSTQVNALIASHVTAANLRAIVPDFESSILRLPASNNAKGV